MGHGPLKFWYSENSATQNKKNDNNEDEKLKTLIKSFSSIKISSVAAIGQPFRGNQGSQIDSMFD